DWLFWLLFAANAVFTAVTAKELLSVLLLSGLVVMAVRAPPRVPGLAVVVPELVIFGFFAKASLVVFGSGLAIVPFLYGGVVEHYHWLNDRQFLDAIAVSMITPGPVVITVAFIGYLVAGASGGLAAAFGMFLPVYVVVIVAAPLYDRIRDNRSMSAFAQGITAAVTGALAGAVIVLGRRAVVDWTTLILCVVTLFLLLQPKFKVPEPIVILIAGTAGVLLAR
ncbi:MAG: chromate transporter, partial [Gemmatimonadota bacterium]